jgi:hypothetical protein
MQRIHGRTPGLGAATMQPDQFHCVTLDELVHETGLSKNDPTGDGISGIAGDVGTR